MSRPKLFVTALALVLATVDCKKHDDLGPVPKDMRNLTAPAKHAVHYAAPGTFIPVEGDVREITWMDSLLPFVNRRVGLAVSSAGSLYRASGGGQGWQLIGRPGKGATIATSRLPKVAGFIAGTSGKQHWLTQDGGETFSQINTTKHGLYDVTFHPHQAGWALAHTGGSACDTNPQPECGLAVTLTSGSSWKALPAKGIRFPYFAWTARFSRAVGDLLSSLGNEIMGTAPKKRLPERGIVAVVAAKHGTTGCNIVRSNDMFKTSHIILHHACEFVVVNGKIFSVRKGVLWTGAAEAGSFKEARLPVEATSLGLLSIMHDTSHFLMVAPNHGSDVMKLSTTPSGILLKSNQDGTTWKEVLLDCHLIRVEKPVPHLRGDVHILNGLHGVYLANQIHKRAGIAAGGGEPTGNVAYTTQTLVTVDSGRSWSSLNPPMKYPIGVSFMCSPAKNDCSLNVVLNKKIANSMPVWTTHDYPGYILAAGALGKEQDTTDINGLFQSSDAGLTWTIVTDHSGMGLFTSLGQGEGTAVVTQTGTRPTVSYYSSAGRDYAENLKSTPHFKATFIATGDNGNSKTPSLVITGADSSGSKGAVFFEFQAWPKPCKDDDFEEWRLGGAAEALWAGCILGHTLDCPRKREGAACYITNRETHLKCKKKDCDCSIRDYECIAGYERKYADDGTPGACSFRAGFGKTPEEEQQRQALSRLYQGNASIESVCNVLQTKALTIPSGYNLYPGDTCVHKGDKKFRKCVEAQKSSLFECSSKYKVYETVPADCPADVPSVTVPIFSAVSNLTTSKSTKTQVPSMIAATPMDSVAKDLFWLGEDNKVALTLTSDHSVYISQNYGKSWKELILPLKPGKVVKEDLLLLQLERNTTTTISEADADFELALAKQMQKIAIKGAAQAVESEASAEKAVAHAKTIKKVLKKKYKKSKAAADREALAIQPTTPKQAVSAIVRLQIDRSRAFIIGRGHTSWLTKDGGQNFLPISTKHKLRGVRLHPMRPNCILAVTATRHPKLILSEDAGSTWRDIASNVFYPHFDWVIRSSAPEQICTITKRNQGPSSQITNWDPNHDLVCFEYVPNVGTMKNSLQVLHANCFFASHKYITAAAAPPNARGPVTLHIGTLPEDKTKITVQAVKLPSKHSVLSLEFIQPDELQSQLFVLASLPKHKGLLYHVNLRKATIRAVLEDVAILSNVRDSLVYMGLPGRYMVNCFTNVPEVDAADGKFKTKQNVDKMETLITLDYGHHWKSVQFKDSDFAIDFQAGFKTTSSTPGIQLATGSVQHEGRFVGPGSTLMLSVDGGCTWKDIYHMHSCDGFWGKEYDIFGDRSDAGCSFQYAVGNHGDTFVIIESHALSNQIHVSHDQGRNWEAVSLPESSFASKAVFGPPSEAAEAYLLSGVSTVVHTHSWKRKTASSNGLMVYLNVSVPVQRRCFGESQPGKLGSDFKLWDPWGESVVRLFDNITGFDPQMKCFHGQRSRYVRRAKMRTMCAVSPGVTFELALETNCACSPADYECIKEKSAHCVHPASLNDKTTQAELCALGRKHSLLQGYRRVDSSVCTGGLSLSAVPTKCKHDEKAPAVKPLPSAPTATKPTEQPTVKKTNKLSANLTTDQKKPESGQKSLITILLIATGIAVTLGATVVYFKIQKGNPDVDDAHQYEHIEKSYPHSAIDDMLDEPDSTIEVTDDDFDQRKEEKSPLDPVDLGPVETGSLSESLAKSGSSSHLRKR